MDDGYAEALDAVRSYVAGAEPLSDTLQLVAHGAVRALRADMAGLTLLYPDGAARTAVFTDDTAVEVDRAQYAADDGPCLAAFRQRGVVVVEDVAVDGRWPAFQAAALDHGIRSTLSSPLIVGGDGIGALNLYSSTTGHFGDDDPGDAEVFAGQAAVALANAQAYWEQADLAGNLLTALASRAVIEQAKGVIMTTSGVGPDAAFDLLRQQSQHENRKLREVAAELVARQARGRARP